MNTYTLRELLEAVTENNKFNNGSWSDWKNAAHIINHFFPNGKFDPDSWTKEKRCREILNAAIKSQGKSLTILDWLDEPNKKYLFG